MPYFKRKQLRLPHYDYSAPGCYFITICTKDRKCILSRISVGVDVPYGWGIGGRVAGDVDPYGCEDTCYGIDLEKKNGKRDRLKCLAERLL